MEQVVKDNSPESHYRNPFLATAMMNLNLVETAGGGIRKLFEIQKKKFFPLPEYELSADKVKVTFTGKIINMDLARKVAKNPDISFDELFAVDKVAKGKHISETELELLKNGSYIVASAEVSPEINGEPSYVIIENSEDNRNLSYGFLTGILRIAQESIFSGLNNLSVNSIMDEDYSQFFGFTSSEVYEMLQYYGMTDKMEELKEWYDGYLFGNEEIYNPWSVINYVSKKGIPQAYWVNTGKNEILVDVLQAATEEIKGQLYDLLQGKSVITRIDQNVVYRALAEDPDNIFSLLLVAGYLKTPKKELQPDGSYLCEVSIPNKEIAAVYKSEILFHLMQIGAITRTTANKIAESLFACNYTKLQKAIAEYLDKSVSFYDGGTEGFYHGLVLGLIALMDNQYIIKSNRESGDGRYDITMFPREKKHPGIIMEFKWKADLKEEEMEQFAADALRQIDEKRYDAELIALGVAPIFKLGIAFSGKRVKVKTI